MQCNSEDASQSQCDEDKVANVEEVSSKCTTISHTPPVVLFRPQVHIDQHWTGRLVDTCGGVWCVTVDSALVGGSVV